MAFVTTLRMEEKNEVLVFSKFYLILAFGRALLRRALGFVFARIDTQASYNVIEFSNCHIVQEPNSENWLDLSFATPP